MKASTTTAILAVGEVVPYTFTVTNIGNVSMTAITVTDPNATGIFCPAFTLAPGVATTCTGSHTVTQADMNAGHVLNTASVTGTPPTGPPIPPEQSNPSDIPIAQIRSMTILKSSTAAKLPAIGQAVPYTFLVTNTGNVTMDAIAVTDPNATGITCPATSLEPGASMNCTGTHTVTQADMNSGRVTNTATVAATPPGGAPITPVPSNEVDIPGDRTPALTIVKNSTTTSITTIGQVVPYTFTVTNAGNVTITAIAVTDAKIGAVTCPATSLDAGAVTICTGNYTVTGADIDSGHVENTASVTGTPPPGSPQLPPTPPSTKDIPAVKSPALTIVKSTTTTSITTVGQVIPYTFLVTNTGNTTINAIVVSDPKIPTVTCPATTLAAAATMTCSGNYTVTQADITAGQLTNTASVTGTPAGGTPITAVQSNAVVLPGPTTTTTTLPSVLPATGSDPAPMMILMIALLTLGTTLVLATRRRRGTVNGL